MELLELLEQLEDTLERGLNVPFSGRCLVRRDEVLELIQDIRLKLPDDIKQARSISEERSHILSEAEQKAEDIVRNAETRITAMVDEHEISRKAVEQAEVIIGNAKKNAREIRLGTREYADGVLDKVRSSNWRARRAISSMPAICRRHSASWTGCAYEMPNGFISRDSFFCARDGMIAVMRPFSVPYRWILPTSSIAMRSTA